MAGGRVVGGRVLWLVDRAVGGRVLWLVVGQ